MKLKRKGVGSQRQREEQKEKKKLVFGLWKEKGSKLKKKKVFSDFSFYILSTERCFVCGVDSFFGR